MAKKQTNPVYSARVNKEILEAFKDQCERMNVDHRYVVSEYMKKFVVLNAPRDRFKKAVLFDNEVIDFLEE